MEQSGYDLYTIVFLIMFRENVKELLVVIRAKICLEDKKDCRFWPDGYNPSGNSVDK